MSNQGQGLLSHFYLGFVCFVLILLKISGEHLQDHWSSGLNYYINYRRVNNKVFLAQYKISHSRILIIL